MKVTVKRVGNEAEDITFRQGFIATEGAIIKNDHEVRLKLKSSSRYKDFCVESLPQVAVLYAYQRRQRHQLDTAPKRDQALSAPEHVPHFSSTSWAQPPLRLSNQQAGVPGRADHNFTK
jgi:hypothetical protein